MTSPRHSSLKQRALHALKWSFLGYGISQAIRLGTNLVMTRLLVPDMFGVMAIAGMITIILGMLSDIGLRQSIVQNRRGEEPAFLDTAWVVQIMRGAGLWVVAILVSIALYLANRAGMVPAQSVYASPLLPLVIAVSSLSAFISGFQSTKMATAQRSFDQKRINVIALVSQCAGLLVMIPFGALSPSVWVLVAGGLMVSLTTTVLSHTWMEGQPNHFRLEKKALRELIEFGKWVFASSALFILVNSGDRLLLGAFVDADVLGLYSIAVLIVGAIQSANSRFANMISLPALSEIARNEPARLREVYYKLRFPADLLLLSLAGFFFAAAPTVIALLYDSRYAATGDMLRILALSFFAMRYDAAQQVYAAIGITRYLTMVNAVRFVSLYTLVPLFFYLGGTQAAIWGIALHAVATVPLVFAFNAKLGLNDFRRELKVLLALPLGFLCGTALNLVHG